MRRVWNDIIECSNGTVFSISVIPNKLETNDSLVVIERMVSVITEDSNAGIIGTEFIIKESELSKLMIVLENLKNRRIL